MPAGPERPSAIARRTAVFSVSWSSAVNITRTTNSSGSAGGALERAIETIEAGMRVFDARDRQPLPGLGQHAAQLLLFRQTAGQPSRKSNSRL